MRILLDTHVLLWALVEPDRLNREVRANIEDSGNDVLFSTATVWEIAIKSALRNPRFAFRPAEIWHEAVFNGFTELPISTTAACRVADLPLLHRDPFDRLLIAQAIVEPAFFFTADHHLTAYSELVCKVG